MRLSVVVITRNGCQRLTRLLRNVQSFADEIIVGVDSSSSDDSAKRAQMAGARTIMIDNPQGYIEPHIRTLVESCHGEWVLRLDDDELISTNFSISSVSSSTLQSFDLIGFPRAWIVQNEPPLYFGTGATPGELVPQYRLMRREADWTFVDRIHTPGFDMKEAFVEDSVFIFHMNLLDFTLDQRRRKYNFYQSVRDAPWNKTYLIEPAEYVRSNVTFPVTPAMHFPGNLCSSASNA